MLRAELISTVRRFGISTPVDAKKMSTEDLRKLVEREKLSKLGIAGTLKNRILELSQAMKSKKEIYEILRDEKWASTLRSKKIRKGYIHAVLRSVE